MEADKMRTSMSATMLAVLVLVGCGSELAVVDDEVEVAGIFRDRKGQRQVMATQASSVYFPDVETEDQLRSALGSFVAEASGLPDNTYFGRTIRVSNPIVATSSIVIDKSLRGLTIDFQGVIITPTDDIDFIIDIRANDVSIINAVLVVPDGLSVDALVGVRDSTTDPVPSFGVVENCKVFGAQQIVQLADGASSDIEGWSILRNHYERIGITQNKHPIDTGVGGLHIIQGNTIVPQNNPGSFGILFGGYSCILSANRFVGFGIILARATASASSIDGNVLFGGTIDTSASTLGLNVIDGNTDTSAITPAVGDIVGDNT